MAICPGPHTLSIANLLGDVISRHSITVLVAGSYQSLSVSTYPLVLGYEFAVELERGYIVTLEILSSLMHKLT
jgi:hypothetical protein